VPGDVNLGSASGFCSNFELSFICSDFMFVKSPAYFMGHLILLGSEIRKLKPLIGNSCYFCIQASAFVGSMPFIAEVDE